MKFIELVKIVYDITKVKADITKALHKYAFGIPDKHTTKFLKKYFVKNYFHVINVSKRALKI